MSDLRRVYDLMRAYVGQGVERIKELDREAARQELLDALKPGGAAAQNPDQVKTAENIQLDPKELEKQARNILGVGPEATFPEIRKQFEKLVQKSDPAHYAAGTPEATIAESLRARITWAYNYLSKDTDATKKRFGSLEIE